MSKFRIEIQMVLIALVIGAAVVTTGYFAYLSLSKIVFSIHREAQPDNRLFLIKDIANDLAFMENKARVYILTDNEADLQAYDTLLQGITVKLGQINKMPYRDSGDLALSDSLSGLAIEKLELWREILLLHQTAKGVRPTFSKIYTKLEKPRIDTVTVETEKKGFFRKIFGTKKITVDTLYREHVPGKEEIKRDIRSVESEILARNRDLKIVESQLIERNIDLEEKLNGLIAGAEKRKSGEFVRRTAEVDRLAALTYKQMAAFTIIAEVLLLIAIFVFFNYLKKSRAYQAALRDTQQKSENLVRAKEQFVANVSHELRTPVNAIYGLTELALQKSRDPELTELISVISKSSRHLKNIIGETLDFSRIQADKIVLESVDFSPSVICSEVLAIHRYEARRKGIGLESRWEGEVPPALKGDPLRLKQILINLIGNAVKFTGEGQVSLVVESREAGDDRVELRMRVEDTGPGISEADLEIIFEEFVQAGNPSANKYPGTGLGLAIVKKLVELQGGDIAVSSHPGAGTQVTVTLAYPRGDERNLPESAGEELPVPASFGRLSVLIADDDEFNSYLLTNILNQWGVRSVAVSNGNDAVEAAVNRNFDLILMDLHMPGMNGPEAAKKIIGAVPDARIVSVSASTRREDLEAGREAGMYRFIFKPFVEKDLYDILVSLLPKAGESAVGSAPPVDTDTLVRLANGDSEYLERMIRLFIKMAETTRARLKESLENEDFERIAEDAHKIAPSCEQIGAGTLYALVRQLEDRARGEGGGGWAGTLVDRVNAEIEAVIGELRNFIKSDQHE